MVNERLKLITVNYDEPESQITTTAYRSVVYPELVSLQVYANYNDPVIARFSPEEVRLLAEKLIQFVKEIEDEQQSS